MTERKRQAEQGIQFAAIDGRRSSQASGKWVFAAAARFVDAELADRIEACPNWRKDYLERVREIVERGARSSKDELRRR